MLKTSGFQVRIYESGIELLKAAPDLEPGCILLDIRMPGMDGLEAQAALQRARASTLPVIIMTGHGDVTLAVQAMKAGAVDFIEKPFEKAVLLGAIEQGFERLEPFGRRSRRARRSGGASCRLLTPREREVLDGLAKGPSQQDRSPTTSASARERSRSTAPI